MIIGIDFGSTTTDIVLVEGNRIVGSFSSKKIPEKNFEEHLKNLGIDLDKVKLVAVTGGHQKKIPARVSGIPVKHVSEIDAIGDGGSVVSGKRNCVVVSMGTGTCIVHHNAEKNFHLGGTGVGGGTLAGLSLLLVGTSECKKIERLALKGDAKKINLSVMEAIGSGIGLVSGNATASNFAKLSSRKKSDLAAALVRMVAEVVAVTACLAASSVKEKNIVFTGKTISITAVRKELRRVSSYYGLKFVFPKNAGFATAIGAASAAMGKQLK